MIKSILICDDDDSFRRQLARSLRRRNYCVYEASNHHEAIECCELYSPTHAIIDLKVAEENGLEISTSLLKMNPSINLLILTGYGSISTAIKAIKSGATNYLTKPCSIDQILEAFNSPQESNLINTNSNLKPAPLAEVEREYIQRTLDDLDGNISQAAKHLGLHRRSLQRKLKSGLNK